MKPEPHSDITEYIQANRATYTREAIERALLDAGHPADEVAAAWARIDQETAAATAATARRDSLWSPRFWLTWLLAMLAIAGISLPLFFATSDQQGTAALIWVVGLMLSAVGGLVLVFVRRLQVYGLALLMTAATLFTLPFIALIVITGICIAQGTTL